MPNCLYCNGEFGDDEVLFAAIGAPMANEANGESDDENDIVGRWVTDHTYDDHMRRFQYMNDKNVYAPRSIFAVRWGKESAKGVGKGTPTQGQHVPAFVELCAEDQKACGTSYLGICCCPRCHSVLPVDYLNTDAKNVCRVALLGGSRAGKTQYLLAVCQNMQAYLASVYQLAMSVETDEVGKRVLERLEEELEKVRFIDRTQLQRIRPIVMTLHQTDKDKYLVLYDVPGEVFELENVNQMLDYEGLMKLADSLLIIADSAGQVFSSLRNDILNRKGTAEEAQDNVRQNAGSNESDQTCMLDTAAEEAQDNVQQNAGSNESDQTCMDLSLNEMIGRYSDYAEAMRRDVQGHFRPYKVIGLLLTKFDKAIERRAATFLEDSSLKCVRGADFEADGQTSVHCKGVDVDAIMAVHGEMSRMLREPDSAIVCNGVLDTIKGRLGKEPIVFGVSTYARPNENEGFSVCNGPSLNRHRVLDPIFYLLAENGLVQRRITEEIPEPRRRFRLFWRR